MGQSPEMWACKYLRTKHFHGVSSRNQHPRLLKLRYGKVSPFHFIQDFEKSASIGKQKLDRVPACTSVSDSEFETGKANPVVCWRLGQFVGARGHYVAHAIACQQKNCFFF